MQESFGKIFVHTEKDTWYAEQSCETFKKFQSLHSS